MKSVPNDWKKEAVKGAARLALELLKNSKTGQPRLSGNVKDEVARNLGPHQTLVEIEIVSTIFEESGRTARKQVDEFFEWIGASIIEHSEPKFYKTQHPSEKIIALSFCIVINFSKEKARSEIDQQMKNLISTSQDLLGYRISIV